MESLESRTLLSATITPIHELDDSTAWRDSVPVINDRGTVVFANNKWILTTSQFAWMTNDGVQLPGLTSGYNGGPNAPFHGTERFPPDLNNSDILVLIQFTDAACTQQELVVYDVRDRQRLQTITTAGEFRFFKDVEINDAGEISVIAEQDDGTGGIYYLSPASSMLQPAIVRPGLAAKLDDLKLLDDGRSVFRVDEAHRYTVTPGGHAKLFATGGYFGDLGVSLYHASRQINSGEVNFEIRFTRHGDNSTWAASEPLPIRFIVRQILSNGQAEIFNSVINYLGEFELDLPVPETVAVPADLAGYVVEMQFEGDPWQVPLVNVDQTPIVLSRDRIHSSVISRVHADSLDEPQSGNSVADISFSKSQAAGNVNDVVSGTYKLIRLGSTNEQDVAEESGSFTIPAGQWSVPLPITLLSDDSPILTKTDNAAFILLYTLHNVTRDRDFGPYLDYYEIDDADYLRQDIWLNTDVPAAINGRGDYAYFVQRPSSNDVNRLILVSNNQVVRDYTEGSTNTIRYPMALSNQQDLILDGRIADQYGLIRMTQSGPEMVIANRGLLTNAPHFAYNLDNEEFDFSVSASGHLVFFSGYQPNTTNSGSADGYGIYAILNASEPGFDLALSNLEVQVSSLFNSPGSLESEILAKAYREFMKKSPSQLNEEASFTAQFELSNTSSTQAQFKLKYRLVLTGVPVDPSDPNGTTQDRITEWLPLPLPQEVVDPNSTTTIKLNLLHPVRDQLLADVLSASSIGLEIAVDSTGETETRLDNNALTWNASEAQYTDKAQEWMVTYFRLLNVAQRPISMYLIEHYLLMSGNDITFPANSIPSDAVRNSAEFYRAVESPLSKLVKNQLTTGIPFTGPIDLAPYIKDTLEYSVVLDDLGTAFRKFAGGEAVYSEVSSLPSLNGKTRTVKSRVTISLWDDYAFDYKDAAKDPFAFHTRLLGLSGRAKPFDSTVEIVLEFEHRIKTKRPRRHK